MLRKNQTVVARYRMEHYFGGVINVGCRGTVIDVHNTPDTDPTYLVEFSGRLRKICKRIEIHPIGK